MAQPLADYASPLQPIPRTAILTAGFHRDRRVRVFPEGWSAAVVRFRPEVLAAQWDQLMALARGWKPDWPLPPRALVAFSIAGEPLAPPELSDMLWNAFGLPLFEQHLAADRRLLASECEAHDGLHVYRPGVIRPGYTLSSERCACGSTTPRLRRTEVREMAMASSAWALLS